MSRLTPCQPPKGELKLHPQIVFRILALTTTSQTQQHATVPTTLVPPLQRCPSSERTKPTACKQAVGLARAKIPTTLSSRSRGELVRTHQTSRKPIQRSQTQRHATVPTTLVPPLPRCPSSERTSPTACEQTVRLARAKVPTPISSR